MELLLELARELLVDVPQVPQSAVQVLFESCRVLLEIVLHSHHLQLKKYVVTQAVELLAVVQEQLLQLLVRVTQLVLDQVQSRNLLVVTVDLEVVQLLSDPQKTVVVRGD